MPIQVRNDEMQAIVQSDLAANGYAAWHEPFGDIGVWNGQFETGPGSGSPDGWPEGWELVLANGTSAISRVTGGLAGNYCMKGGNTQQAEGGYIRSLRYIPVDVNREYYISGAFIADTAAETISLGAEAYNAAKASLGIVYPLAAYAPGVAWVRRQLRIGPLGDVAWPANTRYARVVVYLQGNKALAGYAYCDDIQFGQLKASTSTLLTLLQDRIRDGTSRAFTNQAWTLYPGSTITLTLDEESWLWYSFQWNGYNSAVRTTAINAAPFIDGVQEPSNSPLLLTGAAAVNTYLSHNIGLMRSTASYARGAHTIDLRIYVSNAGDTYTARYLTAAAFATRRY